MRVVRILAGGLLLLLGGCLGGREAPPAVNGGHQALPLPTRAMLFISPRDLDRPLIIEATQFRNEETSTQDGRLLEKASLSVLRQVFQQVDTNLPSTASRVIVKVQGQAKFSRRDRMLKVSCSMDVYQADGSVVGSFFARHDGAEPVEYKEAIEPGYARCLTKASDDMLASPSMSRLVKSGFPAPNPAAYSSFVVSLGLKP